ncbi:MAG: acyl-CoA thioesterase [Gammaproteobacteria bacterium]|nr:acyl-CoA thioesterase [Gammaproteobacteria bacterium]
MTEAESGGDGVAATEVGLPQGRTPLIRLPATPQVANKGGSIFGGWIMSQVDICGSIPAEIRAGGRIVTRAVHSFEFKKPVFVGDLIACYADIIKEGRSSMHIFVEVYAQRIRGAVIECIKVTEATVIYVAVDEQGRPRSLPPKKTSGA